MPVFAFNARQVAPSAVPVPVPAGEYPVIITESTLEDASTGGKFYKFVMTIQPGNEFAGRNLYFNANVENANPQAVAIAYAQISAIAWCIGRPEISKTEDLHGVPLLAIVTVDKNGQNSIKGFKSINGDDPKDIAEGKVSAQSQTQPGAQQQQPYQQQTYQPQASVGGYGPPQPIQGNQPAPPPPPPAVDPSASWQRTPDGAYKLNPATNQWEPNTAPPPPPPAAQGGYQPGAQTMPGQVQQPVQGGPPQGWSQQPGGAGAPGWVKTA